MSQLLGLKQSRAALVGNMTSFLNRIADEKRGMNADEKTQFDKMTADEASFRSTIEAIEATEGIARTLDDTREQHERAQHAAGEGDKLTYDEAFAKWLRSRTGSVTPEVRSVLHANLGEQERRDLSEASGAAGAYTIPSGFRAMLVEAQKFVGGVRTTRATVFQTATGNPLVMPTDNDATSEGAQLGETTGSSNDTSTPFGQASFSAYKYSSKTMKISIELLQDSAFNVPAIIASMLGKRLFRIQNRHYTVGNGTTQPQGLVTAAATVAAASLSAIAYADLLSLEFGVDAAYRNNSAEWMMHDLIWKEVLKLVDSTGRPLINGVNVGIAAGEPDTLRNRPVRFNQHMASAFAANALLIAFGDMSAYNVRDSLGYTLIRFNELYMEAQEVGFSMIGRTDGRYVNAGTDPVKVLKQPAT